MRYLLIPALLAAALFAIGFIPARNAVVGTVKNQVAEVVQTIPEIIKPKSTTLLFGGDIMLARSVAKNVDKEFGGDFSQLFVNLPEMKDADIAFANLEGPISARGRNVGSIYSFRFDPKVAPVLADMGFDVLSIANNHMGDWTLAAFEDTLVHLHDANIGTAGGGKNIDEAKTPYVIEKNGMRFGYIALTDVGPNWLAATDTQAGILIANPTTLPDIVQNAKSWCDFLVVSFHWGTEYKPHNARQSMLAHLAIDNGADMIIGHHPHVEQGTEWYNGKFIAYSLGNFIFDQYFSPETMQGLVIEAEVDKDKNVSIKEFDIKLNKLYQPEGIFSREETVETN